MEMGVKEQDIIHSALQGRRRDLSRLLTLIESGFEPNIPLQESWTMGVTGPPGAGKSSLIGNFVDYWSSRGDKVAVLAVDPSSPKSGGALIGDRMRMASADSGDSVFVRSLATSNHPGGLSAYISTMIDCLAACGWNKIVIETVGSGQSDYRIAAFADRILLVDGPDRGDIVQAEKAGIIELADIIVVNKSDLEGSEQAAEAINSSLSMDPSPPPVHLVCSHDGSGIEELIHDIENCIPEARSALRTRERLISAWDSRLLNNPELNRVVGLLETGSITLEDAIKEIASYEV